MISNSVVCIPTLKRPEFLALCLEKISQTAEGEHLDVRIFVDFGIPNRLEDVEYVRDTFLPTAEIFQAGAHESVLSGTWNILNSLRNGFEANKEFVFFIEEDVMVRPNFFQWHWDTHTSDEYFVTCGRKYLRMPLDFYSNPGTCYRRDKLALVMPHINKDYYGNTEAYVNRVFPQYKGQDGSLDDGLIRKVIRSVKGKVVCAVPNVAVHQGFRHYNRLEPFLNGGKTIQERIEALRKIVANINPEYRYTLDFEPF